MFADSEFEFMRQGRQLFVFVPASPSTLHLNSCCKFANFPCLYRQVRQNHIWPRQVCQLWIWIHAESSPNLNFNLFRHVCYILCLSQQGLPIFVCPAETYIGKVCHCWDSYRQGSPLLRFISARFAIVEIHIGKVRHCWHSYRQGSPLLRFISARFAIVEIHIGKVCHCWVSYRQGSPFLRFISARFANFCMFGWWP